MGNTVAYSETATITSVKRSIIHAPVANGKIQILDLGIMSEVFYHCATGVQLASRGTYLIHVSPSTHPYTEAGNTKGEASLYR